MAKQKLKGNKGNTDMRVYSFSQLSHETGLTKTELMKIARDHGLIDSSGKPTPLAQKKRYIFQ